MARDIITLDKDMKKANLRHISPDCCATCKYHVWMNPQSMFDHDWRYGCVKFDNEETGSLGLCDLFERKEQPL